MVVGHDVTKEDKLAISMEGEMMEHVQKFQYLDSKIAANGCVDDE